MDTKIPQSAMRQIHSAIDLLRNGGFEASITLAHAAENQLPTPKGQHLFTKLKAAYEALPEADKPSKHGLNDQANWLKHGEIGDRKRDEASITEDAAITYVTRAISKFVAVFGGMTPQMGAFRDWALERQMPTKDQGPSDS
jgi:hypothetical protein